MRKIERLNLEHLAVLLYGHPMRSDLEKSYLSDGSVGYCLVVDGLPVFAGGVVNLQWQRGEAWILPTPFFRKNIRVCYKYLRDLLPVIRVEGGFKRIQATCAVTVSALLFEHLGFGYEGTMHHFGPNGETCHMYAKVFR
jgi:hypothetical protein